MKKKFQKNQKALIAFVVFICIAGLIFYWRTGSEDIAGDNNVKTGNYRLEDGLFAEAVQEFLKRRAQRLQGRGFSGTTWAFRRRILILS